MKKFWKEWLDTGNSAGDACVEPPYPVKNLYVNGRTVSLGRAVCANFWGWETDDMLKSPVRSCATPGCLNGSHWRWGTLSEARAGAAKTGVSRAGDNAGNKKVTSEIVAALRSDKSLNTPYARHLKARELGITDRSLLNILQGKTWRNVLNATGDEF
jgi:hypothetical protein